MPQVKIRISSESTDKVEAKAEGQTPSTESRERIAGISMFAHQTLNTAKKIVNYNINNVGVKTGNYVLQEQISESVDVVSDISTIGLGIAAGGLFGGIVAIAGVTTKQIFKEISRNEEIKHQNIESDYLARRSGNTTTNGSRGTEN